ACLALEYACLLRYSYFFGELAINESGRTAFLQGLSLNPDGRISLNILYARINRGYNSLHGKTSFSGALNRPSENLLANISSQPASFISFHGGILHKKQLWYNNISAGFPSSLQYLLRIKIDPYDNISINTDIRRSISDTYILPERGMKTSTPAKKTNFRFSLETTVSEHLFLRTRLEKTLIAGSSDNGILCYQSFNYDFSKIPLGIRCRLTVFRTGSWDSRIYAWEDDLLYNPTVKAFYGAGKRSYIMLIYRPAGALSLRLKYAVSDIPSRQEETGIIREYNLQALMRF
ncbi:MAG: hypothetical protein KFF49_12885, partial [Bacteroidales bacterium]|nr:hypothetical protein [Bacteroidales bacterium]